MGVGKIIQEAKKVFAAGAEALNTGGQGSGAQALPVTTPEVPETSEIPLNQKTVEQLAEAAKDKASDINQAAKEAEAATKATEPALTQESNTSASGEPMDTNKVTPEVPLTAAANVEPKHEEAETKAEEKKEEAQKKEAAFSMEVFEGTNFDDSYIVAKAGDDFRAVKLARIIPAPVQETIIKHVASKSNEPCPVIGPKEIVAKLVAAGVNSLASFTETAAALERAAAEENKKFASLKREAGLMSWNEDESKAPKVKVGEAPDTAFSQEELEAGKKLSGKEPSPMHSDVPSYYKRLPKAGGGEPTSALNINSSRKLQATIDMLRGELDRKAAELVKAETELDQTKGELGKMKDDNKASELAQSVQAIVTELSGKGLLDSKNEPQVISILSKIEDAKIIGQLAQLMKLLGGGKKNIEQGIHGDMEPGMPKPGASQPPMPKIEKPMPKMAATIPPQFLPESGLDAVSASELMSRIWNNR